MSVRVMLVDDEPIATQATAVMLRKTDPSFEVVGMCFSGREAVNKAALLHPEIIIMDIQMPGINGLEAIRKIKEHSPDTFFIVLSAYSEFTYAVEALALGACDYLLKPVKQSAFAASLEKVAADISARKENMDFELRQQERLQIALPMIKKDFIRSLLPGSMADEQLLACYSFLDLTDRCGIMVAISHRNEGIFPLDGILGRLSSINIELIADLVAPDLVVAFFPLASDLSDSQAYIKSIVTELNALLDLRAPAGEDLLAGVASTAEKSLQLKLALDEALSALEALKKRPHLKSRCLIFDSATMEGASQEVLTAVDTHISSTRGIIEKAINYIDRNYQNELTLDEVATVVNLSPYYFSRLFKENTGSNFSERLIRVRIEHAKKLLVETDRSVKDVSFEVGYRDPNYFSKVFHKVTGVKASDYRNLHEMDGGQI